MFAGSLFVILKAVWGVFLEISQWRNLFEEIYLIYQAGSSRSVFGCCRNLNFLCVAKTRYKKMHVGEWVPTEPLFAFFY